MNANEFLEQNKDKISLQSGFLQLSYKDENGNRIFTGPHILKIISNERTTAKDFMGYMREVIRYKFVELLGKDEEGKDKTKLVQYDINCWAKDKEGKEVNYLLVKMGEFAINDKIIMEQKMSGIKTITVVSKYIPDLMTKEKAEINLEKNNEIERFKQPIQSEEDDIPIIEDGEEIDIKDIPF